MKYRVKLHPQVEKFLSKLPKNISTRIQDKLRSLKEESFLHLEHFAGKNVYKFRVGTYRALIDVDTSRRIVLV